MTALKLPLPIALSPVDVKARLEDAGRTLLMLPLPKDGYPGDSRTSWPEIVRTPQEWFVLQVFADVERISEISDDRNRVRMRPTARQIQEMSEAVEWVYRHVKDTRLRKVTFARALVHPLSGRHVVSYAKLGKQFGLHRNTIISWHDKALSLIACALAAE